MSGLKSQDLGASVKSQTKLTNYFHLQSKSTGPSLKLTWQIGATSFTCKVKVSNQVGNTASESYKKIYWFSWKCFQAADADRDGQVLPFLHQHHHLQLWAFCTCISKLLHFKAFTTTTIHVVETFYLASHKFIQTWLISNQVSGRPQW